MVMALCHNLSSLMNHRTLVTNVASAPPQLVLLLLQKVLNLRGQEMVTTKMTLLRLRSGVSWFSFMGYT